MTAVSMFGVKNPIVGCVDRAGAPPNASYDPPVVTSYVYSYGGHDGVYWSELQPTSGSSLDSTVIADLRGELDAASGAGYTGGIKLRVLCGINSPAWLKTAVGTFKCDTTSTGGPASEADCPMWFLPAYVAAYDELMRLLSDEFDDHPALRDVAITADGLHYGEPYVRKINQNATSTTKTTRANIWNAFYAARATPGFADRDGVAYVTTGAPDTDRYHGKTLDRVDGHSGWWKTDRHYGLVHADMDAMRAAVRTHNEWWAQTRSSLAVNPYQQICRNDDGVTINGTVDNTPKDLTRPYRTWTLASMMEARQLMSQRVVLGNNSIRYTPARTGTGSDTFDRADTAWGSGWGTASGGGTYTSGDISDVRVNAGAGEIRQDSSGDRRLRHTATATGDSEVLIGIAWSAHAAGAAHHVSTELCVQDVAATADGFYEIELEELTSGVVRIRWRKNDSTVGSTTALPAAAVENVTVTSSYPLGTTVWVRGQVEAIGDDQVELRAKAWLDIETEPSDWQIIITDDSPDLVDWSGHLGIRANAGTGYTATSNVWSVVSWAVTPVGTPTLTASVGGPSASAKYERIYQTQAELGGPTYYQTAAPSRLPNANWLDVLKWTRTDTTVATSLGQHGQQATYVELPSSYDGRGGYTAWSASELYASGWDNNWPYPYGPYVYDYWVDELMPQWRVYVGFRMDPNNPPAPRWTVGDATYGQVGMWPLGSNNEYREVTDDVMSISLRRGFDRDSGMAEPSQCNIRLRNETRKYDPANPDSPYRNGIWANIPVQVRVFFQGWEAAIWTGFVDEWSCDYDMPIEGVVDVKCSDIQKLMALTEVPEDPEMPGAGDTSMQRVRRLLEMTRFATVDGDRDVFTFGDPLSLSEGAVATMSASKFGGKLLDQIRKTVEAEHGICYPNYNGTLQFGGRYYLERGGTGRTVQYMFGDGDSSGEMCYSSLDVNFTDRELLTEVVCTREGADHDDDRARQVASDDILLNQSGLPVQLSKSYTMPFDRDTLSLGFAEYVLRKHSWPGLYVDGFKMRPRTREQAYAAIVLRPGDRVAVRRRPKHADGSMLHVDSHITSISHDIEPGNRWTVSFECRPAPPPDDVWIVGDLTSGRVGYARMG